MKRRILLLPLLLLVVQTSVSHRARADEDLFGDNYPHVVATDGGFQVTSVSLGDGNSTFWRTTYSPEGKTLTPRHQILESDANIFARQGGRSDVFHLHEAAALSPSKNEFGVRLTSSTGEVVRLSPAPFDARVSEPGDCWMNKDSAAFLWAEPTEDFDSLGNRRQMLHLAFIPRGDPSKPLVKELGWCLVGRMIRASNLVWARDRLWVAWIRVNSSKTTNLTDTVLSNYDPMTDKVETKSLEEPAQTSDHPSLATTGDWLCAAWSRVPKGENTMRVFTTFEKLPLHKPAVPGRSHP